MPPDKPWKAYERRIAKRLGGQRTGPLGSDVPDVAGVPGYAVECKLLARPSYQLLLEAALQAERNAKPFELPVAVVKRTRDHTDNALVVMRLVTWEQWHGPGSSLDAPESPRTGDRDEGGSEP